MNATTIHARLLLAAAAVALSGTAALAAPTLVSGASPFSAGCGNFPGNPDDNPINYVDSEVEPFLAVNPSNPLNLIAVWQQDRWSNGGARGNGYARSTDGGVTWSNPAGLPNLTTCSVPAGLWERSTDPWVTFSPNGTAYAFSLTFQALPPPHRPGGDGANAMLVHRSTDGGATWTGPIKLIEDDNPRFFNDKNSITADPTNSNYVYAVWDRLKSSSGSIINPENVFGLGYHGPAYLARTTNGGASWEPARAIYDPGANNQTIGNQIVVLPSGTVLNFFNEILNFKNSDGGGQFDFNLAFLASTDKGTTWRPKGQPNRVQKIQSMALFRASGVILPDTQDDQTTVDDESAVRTGDILFDVGVDPRIGTSTMYAVWQDARFSNFQIDQIALSRSTDGGQTWSAPIKVNQTPTNIPILRQQAFTPSVEVTAAGKVIVTYYDFRNDNGNGELTDYWSVECTTNCQSNLAWVPGAETRLTLSSFDMHDAPFARGYFTGDYEGLVGIGDVGAALWSQPQGGDPGNLLFTLFDKL